MQQFPYIAEIFVLGGIASAAVIAADLRTCRQPMRIMNSVWILTGLWASFFGLWAYYAFGRVKRCTLDEKESRTEGTAPRGKNGSNAGFSGEMPGTDMHGAGSGGTEMPGTDMHGAGSGRTEMPGTDMHGAGSGGTKMPGMDMHSTGSGGTEMAGMDMHGMRMEEMEMPARSRWQSAVLSTLHCGAGCTLADLVGEWFLFFVPVAIGGSMIAGSWVFDYILALVFGIGFQYAAIRGMEPKTPRGEIVRRAAKADILSLTAWQAGMYGWMAVVIFALNGGATLPRTSFQFWFMMQIAMACGFLVVLPVNVGLIRAGIKKGM